MKERYESSHTDIKDRVNGRTNQVKATWVWPFDATSNFSNKKCNFVKRVEILKICISWQNSMTFTLDTFFIKKKKVDFFLFFFYLYFTLYSLFYAIEQLYIIISFIVVILSSQTLQFSSLSTAGTAVCFITCSELNWSGEHEVLTIVILFLNWSWTNSFLRLKSILCREKPLIFEMKLNWLFLETILYREKPLIYVGSLDFESLYF